MAAHQAGRLSTHEIEWTPRQKQVLDLLAHGHTNGQIAEALGITLDGAKWHVGEIIAKLDVDTREEAAEYWRQRQGFRARLRLVTRTGSAPSLLRWLGIGVAAAAVVVVAAVTGFMLLNGGDDDPAAPDPSPTTVATGTADPSATVTQAPGDAGITEIEGVPVQQLTMGEPAWPEDLMVIIEDGCWGCEGPTSALVRMYRDAHGEIIRDTLFEASGGDEAYILHYDISADAQRMLATVCSRGYCGSFVEPTPDAEVTVYESLDGGITWVVLFTEAWVGWFDYAPTGGYLYQRLRNVGTYEGADLYSWPSMELVSAIPRDVSRPLVLADGSVVRKGASGRALVRDDASVFFELRDPKLEFGQAVATADGAWVLLSFSSSIASWYAGLESDGELAWVISKDARGLAPDEQIEIYGVLNSSTLLGSQHAGMWPTPVLVDLATGTVRQLDGPFAGLSDSPDATGGRNRLVSAAWGPFARVTNAGTCLNVGEEPTPDAAVIACHADGVLLRDRGEEEDTGGVTWVAVTTPDGREGWVSAEFLVR